MTLTDTASLEERYGRTPKRRRQQRWLYIGGGAAVALVVIAWVVWAGLDQANSTLDAEDIGNTIINSRSVEVKYQISVPIGQKVTCALQVENADHAITGWKIVKVPTSQTYTTNYSDVVKSTEKPTTGLIYQCWLT